MLKQSRGIEKSLIFFAQKAKLQKLQKREISYPEIPDNLNYKNYKTYSPFPETTISTKTTTRQILFPEQSISLKKSLDKNPRKCYNNFMK